MSELELVGWGFVLGVLVMGSGCFFQLSRGTRELEKILDDEKRPK